MPIPTPTTTLTRPSPTEHAAQLVPLLRRHAKWAEDNRAIHEEVLDGFAGTDVLKMRRPLRYGGLESDAATVYAVIAQLARGDGSAAWNAAVWTISSWLAAQFPDHVQDEVFGDENARVCSVLSPTGMAQPADGGVTVNGRWHFVSGARHSQWQVVMAMAPTPDGQDHWPVIALVPMDRLRIEDDWHTMGLRGTGSVSTVAENVFVPADHVLPLPVVLQGGSASATNPHSESGVYRTPLLVSGCNVFVGTAIGLVKECKEAFLARLDHKVTYTDYASRREASAVHLVVAEAAMKIEEAEAHAERLTAAIDNQTEPEAEWTLEDRVTARARLGRAFRLANEAARLLGDESGGSSIYTGDGIQRAVRDLHALSTHALMHPMTNAELYGRILCGMPPNTMYL
jgi:alkylation response protein AidB-like acyl-CoA dehydrogenase